MNEIVSKLREIRQELELEGRAIVNISGASRATSLIATSLEKSRMWLGKCIGEFNPKKSPYAKLHNSNVYIPPTADVDGQKHELEVPYQNELLNCVVAINYIREEYQRKLHVLSGEVTMMVRAGGNRKSIDYLDKAIEELELAKMYCGVRLSEIRNFVIENPTEETAAIINEELADKLYQDVIFTSVQKEESKTDFKAENILDEQPDPRIPNAQNGKVLEEFKKDTEILTSEGPGATFQTENPGANEGQEKTILDQDDSKKPINGLNAGNDEPAL